MSVNFTRFTVNSDIRDATGISFLDLNGDKLQDIAAASSGWDTDQVLWHTSNVGGSISTTPFSVGNITGGRNALYGADMDRDGDVDIVAAETGGDDIDIFYNNNGFGTSWGGHKVADGFDGATKVYLADYATDGYPDIVAVASNENDLLIWRQTATGSFTKTNIDLSLSNAAAVYGGDINRDGRIDVIAGGSQGVFWYQNLDNGSTWAKIGITNELQPEDIKLADLNGDGWLDAAIATEKGIYTWMNGGSISRVASLNAQQVAIADIDHDGDNDLVFGSYSTGATLYWYSNNGSGSFEGKLIDNLGLNYIKAVATGDADNDGFVDIAISTFGEDDIYWYRNNLRKISIEAGTQTIKTTNPSEPFMTTGGFKISMDEASPRTIALSSMYAITGTAKRETDFTTIEFYFYSGQTYAELFVVPINDLPYDPDETITVTLKGNGIDDGWVVDPAKASATLKIEDPTPVISISSVSDPAEPVDSTVDGEIGTITIALNTFAKSAFRVPYTLAGSSEDVILVDGDKDPADGSLYGEIPIAAGFKDKVVKVYAKHDTTFEQGENFVFTLLPESPFYNNIAVADLYRIDKASNSATLFIGDNEPTVSFGAIKDLQEESPFGDFIGYVDVEADYEVTDQRGLRVYYTISSATATQYIDYFNSQGRLEESSPAENVVFIPYGAKSARLYLSALPDAVSEDQETITLSLLKDKNPNTDPTFATGDTYSIGNRSTVTLTIIDSGYYAPSIAILDRDGVAVTPSRPLEASSTGQVEFGIRLTSQPKADVVVTIAGVALTFTPLNWDKTQTVEWTGTKSLTATGSSSDSSYNGLSVIVNIVADDQNPQLTVSEGHDQLPTIKPTASILLDREVTEGTDLSGAFTILLSNPAPVGGLQLNYRVSGTAAANTDYQTLSGRLTILEGESRATINIAVIDDDSVESDESVILELLSGEGYILNAASTAELTITDDDIAGITFARAQKTASISTDSEKLDIRVLSFSNRSGSFTVALMQVPTSTMTVTLMDNLNAINSKSLVFTTENWNSPQIVSLRGLTEIENVDHQFELMAVSESQDGNQPSQTLIAPIVTNQLITPISNLLTTENQTEQLLIKLNSQPRSDVTVSFSDIDATENVFTTNKLAFSTSNWNTYHSVTIRGLLDNRADGDVTYNVKATSSSDDPSYNGTYILMPVTTIDIDSDVINNEPAIDDNIELDPLVSISLVSQELISERADSAGVFRISVNQAATGEAVRVRYSVLTKPGENDASEGIDYEAFNFFEEQQADDSPFLVDAGSYSAPALIDLEGDGDPDLVLGNYDGVIEYYENIGNPKPASFIKRSTNPFSGIDLAGNTSPGHSMPTFVDLDGDGDQDLVLGSSDGRIRFYRNTNKTFTETSGTDNPFQSIVVGSYSAPTLADYDADGDHDLFVGCGDGTIKLFKNKGTETSAVFDEPDEQNPFIGLDLGDNASIVFADLDGDNDIDAVLTGDNNASSSSDAIMQYWINNGSPSQANFVLDNSLLARSDFNIPDNVRPAFADIDGDSDADLLLGNLHGVIDYYENLSSGELSIIPGQYQDVEIKPISDVIAEDDENITVILNTNQGYYIDSSNNTIKFTIQDDDTAGIRITDSTGADATSKIYTTSEAEPRAQLFNVRLTSQPLDSVTIYLGSTMQAEASLSADYQDDQRIISLYFTPSNWDTAQSFSVNPKDDLIDDNDTAYSINATIRSGDRKYKNLTTSPINLINVDNDVAGIKVEPLDNSSAEGSQNTIQLSLETQPQAPVAIVLTPSNSEIRFLGQAFTHPLKLTFTEETWSLPQTVSVFAVNDSKVEYNHNASISFDIQTADKQYAVLTAPPIIEVSIQDDDLPLASLAVAQNAAEEALPGYFTINLSEPANAVNGATGVVVNYEVLTSSSATNGVDYQQVLSTGTARIAPGKTSTSIIISPIDNSKDEADKQVTIQLLAGEGYDLSSTSSNTLVITNNDQAGVQIIQSGIVPVVEEGQSYSFYVSLLSEPTQPTTINFIDINNQLENVDNISFESADWYRPQKVTIKGTDENVAEPEENHTSTLSLNFTGAPEYENIDQPVDLKINIIDRTFDSVNASLGLEYSLNSFERAFTESSLALIGSASKLPIFFDEITKAITNKVYATNYLTAWKLEQIFREQLVAALGVNLSDLDITYTPTGDMTTFSVAFKTTYLDQVIELAPDLSLPMLELAVNGEVQVDLQYGFELGFVFSKSEGFFLDSSSTALQTIIKLEKIDLDQKDCINGLSVDFQDNGSEIALDYDITMQSSGVAEDPYDDLSASQFVSTSQLQPLLSKTSEDLFNYFDYQFTEDSEIKLAVSAEPDDAIIDYFPGLYFNYNAYDIPLLNYSDPAKAAAIAFTVEITKAALDVQSMARGYVKKYVDIIDEILQPFYPIIDFLNADTKFLSALKLDYLFDSNNDNKVSVLELLMTFLNVRDGSGDNDVLKNLTIKGFDDGDTLDFYEFIDAINELIEVVRIVDEYLESPTNVLIDIGAVRATAMSGELKFEKENVIPITGDILTRIKQNPWATADLVKLIDSILAIDGLEIPLLTDFFTVAELLTGESNVNFLTYDIPDLDIDLNLDLSDIGLEAILPKYGLDSVLSLSIGLKTDLYLAYDSYGLDLWKQEVCSDMTATDEEKANDKQDNNAMLLLEGLYVRDVDSKGKDVAEMAASFAVDIGLEANAVVARARMTGGVQSDNDVKIDFFDTDEEIYGNELSPTRDGIIRYGEFAPLFSGDLSVLEVNGAIEAFLNTKLEVGVDLGITEVMETILDIDIYTYTLWDAEYALSKIGLKGFASQSPLQGGTVFFDANMNGKHDAGEPVSVSHEDGSFNVTIDRNAYDRNRNGRIDSSEGRLVIVDGVDAATGLPMATPLFASVDSNMITPLTSMIQKLEQEGFDPALAESRIKEILALQPDIDLASYNPATAIAVGDANRKQVYVAHVMSQAAFAVFSQFIGGVKNLSAEQVADQVIGIVSRSLYEDQEPGFDNPGFIRRLVGALLSGFGEEYSDAQEEEFAAVFSRILTISDQVVSTTADNSSLDELVSQLSPLKTAIQHDLRNLLHQFGEGLVNATFVDQSLNDWQARVQLPAPINDGAAIFSISGTAAVGTSLIASIETPDPDGNGSFVFDWQSSTNGLIWSSVGTNSTSYLVASADQGKQLRLVVSYTDGQGFAESVTVDGGSVPNLPPPPVPPTIGFSSAPPSQHEGNIGTTPYTYYVTRSGDQSQVSTVRWHVVGSGLNSATATDFALGVLPSGILTFQPGQDALPVVVNVVGDMTLEAHERFDIVLSAPTNAVLASAKSTLSSEITNDDLPEATYSFTAFPDPVYEGNLLAIGVITSNVAPGTQVFWRFSGSGITATDFSDGLLTDNIYIGMDGRAAFTRRIAADAEVDPDETLELRFFADSSYTQQIGSTTTITLKEPNVGVATDDNDILTGTPSADTISGIPTGSSLRGRGSLDHLTGNGSADTFVLGDAFGVYYDDGTPGLGTVDLAVITEITPGDRIQLSGTQSDYRLVSGRHNQVRGVRIDALSGSPGGGPEAIGFVQGATLATLNLSDPTQFLYV